MVQTGLSTATLKRKESWTIRLLTFPPPINLWSLRFSKKNCEHSVLMMRREFGNAENIYLSQTSQAGQKEDN